MLMVPMDGDNVVVNLNIALVYMASALKFLLTMRLIIVLFVVFSSCNSSNENSKVLIKSEISGIRDSIKVYISSTESIELIDSSLFVNEKFEIRGEFEEPKLVLLSFWDDKLNKSISRKYIWIGEDELFIVSNIDSVQTKDVRYFSTYEIKKSQLNKTYTEFINKQESLNLNRDKKAFYKYLQEFAFSNPDNYLSIYLMFKHREYISKSQLTAFYKSIGEKYRNSTLAKSIQKYSLTEKIKSGNYLREIYAKNIDGEEFKLSDYKGKIILLNFWASWCAPCRYHFIDEIPKLINKYDDNFIVISISLDQSYSNWKKASINDQINWINVSDLKGSKSINAINYDVKGIPRFFIINEKGYIENIELKLSDGTIERKLDSLLLDFGSNNY